VEGATVALTPGGGERVVNPGLLLTLAILVAKASQGVNSQPVWMTVVIASGSAVVGAVVGGVATYLASSRLEKRLRTARAAIRRKAKIYTPLRSDLRDLLSYLESSDRLTRIDTEPWARRRYGGLTFATWEEMKEDGRDLTLAKKPAEAMAKVAAAIDAFNQEFDRGEVLAKEITREALKAHPDANHDWPSAPNLWRFIDHSIQPHEVGIETRPGEPADSRTPRVHQEVVALIERDPRTTSLVASVSTAIDDLRASLRAAIKTLEESMKAIANRYEVPREED